MNINPIKTRTLNPPQDDLLTVIKQADLKLQENSIVAVTSKVVSIWQGRCVAKDAIEKDELIKQEADLYLDRDASPHGWAMHTIKNNILGRSAGVDESNADDFYVLWPKDLAPTAKQLWEWFRTEYKIKNLGVIITDSQSIPLRRGAIGHALSYFGFKPLHDYREETDLFGREFKVEQANLADGLAAAAVVAMGEGSESTPLAIISDVPGIEFIDHEFNPSGEFTSFETSLDDDIFSPFFKNAPWKKGEGQDNN